MIGKLASVEFLVEEVAAKSSYFVHLKTEGNVIVNPKEDILLDRLSHASIHGGITYRMFGSRVVLEKGKFVLLLKDYRRRLT